MKKSILFLISLLITNFIYSQNAEVVASKPVSISIGFGTSPRYVNEAAVGADWMNGSSYLFDNDIVIIKVETTDGVYGVMLDPGTGKTTLFLDDNYLGQSIDNYKFGDDGQYKFLFRTDINYVSVYIQF